MVAPRLLWMPLTSAAALATHDTGHAASSTIAGAKTLGFVEDGTNEHVARRDDTRVVHRPRQP